MPPLLLQLVHDIPLSGSLSTDVTELLTHYGFPQVASHCQQVVLEAKRLALCFAADPARAETAGWLHDISAILPAGQRIEFAEQLGLDILAEECLHPMILHQKLSAVISHELFGVHDPAVLSAIECHTTLKANSSILDKIVFIADKVQWDQQGAPPYQAAVVQGLETSLDLGVWGYLSYLWSQRATLPVVHPWFVEAYQQLKTQTAEYLQTARLIASDLPDPEAKKQLLDDLDTIR